MTRLVHWRRPLALVSLPRAFALIKAIISRSLADPILFLLTKLVGEPNYRLLDTFGVLKLSGCHPTKTI
jgi:hypothetical protein